MCEYPSEHSCLARKLQRQGLKWGDTPQVAIHGVCMDWLLSGHWPGEGSLKVVGLWVIVGTKEDNWCSLPWVMFPVDLS